MATIDTHSAGCVVLHNIAWDTYKTLRDDEYNRNLRFTYDRGELEIMSPSREHERVKTLIGRMIETFTEILDIPISSGGSTTYRSEAKDRGLEPDECYYVANEAKMRGKDEVDLEIDPPPDLVVEVDITRRWLNRTAIYADLGVPEIWEYHEDKLIVHLLQPDGTYTQDGQSKCFPMIPLDGIQRFLDQRGEGNETSWIRSFREWVRTLDRS
ncbi:MAG: Uma2 family endonuclease [Pirellulales bacterium]|nr:Uma2 family endonuclease [Pirellulales bacterium]